MLSHRGIVILALQARQKEDAEAVATLASTNRRAMNVLKTWARRYESAWQQLSDEDATPEPRAARTTNIEGDAASTKPGEEVILALLEIFRDVTLETSIRRDALRALTPFMSHPKVYQAMREALFSSDFNRVASEAFGRYVRRSEKARGFIAKALRDFHALPDRHLPQSLLRVAAWHPEYFDDLIAETVDAHKDAPDADEVEEMRSDYLRAMGDLVYNHLDRRITPADACAQYVLRYLRREEKECSIADILHRAKYVRQTYPDCWDSSLRDEVIRMASVVEPSELTAPPLLKKLDTILRGDEVGEQYLSGVIQQALEYGLKSHEEMRGCDTSAGCGDDWNKKKGIEVLLKTAGMIAITHDFVNTHPAIRDLVLRFLTEEELHTSSRAEVCHAWYASGRVTEDTGQAVLRMLSQLRANTWTYRMMLLLLSPVVATTKEARELVLDVLRRDSDRNAMEYGWMAAKHVLHEPEFLEVARQMVYDDPRWKASRRALDKAVAQCQKTNNGQAEGACPQATWKYNDYTRTLGAIACGVLSRAKDGGPLPPEEWKQLLLAMWERTNYAHIKVAWALSAYLPDPEVAEAMAKAIDVCPLHHPTCYIARYALYHTITKGGDNITPALYAKLKSAIYTCLSKLRQEEKDLPNAPDDVDTREQAHFLADLIIRELESGDTLALDAAKDLLHILAERVYYRSWPDNMAGLVHAVRRLAPRATGQLREDLLTILEASGRVYRATSTESVGEAILRYLQEDLTADPALRRRILDMLVADAPPPKGGFAVLSPLMDEEALRAAAERVFCVGCHAYHERSKRLLLLANQSPASSWMKKVLLTALYDDDPDVREMAGYVLASYGYVGDDIVRIAMEDALADEHPHIREMARKVLDAYEQNEDVDWLAVAQERLALIDKGE